MELIDELALSACSGSSTPTSAVTACRPASTSAAYRDLADRSPMTIIASGRHTSLDDVRALASIGRRVEGAIVGTALYEGSFTLPEAIAAGRDRGERA
jgi:uncharacterized protein related to proFAR isomerase